MNFPQTNPKLNKELLIFIGDNQLLENLAIALRKENYDIQVVDLQTAPRIRITGNSILGFVDFEYSKDYQIFIDARGCFNKYSDSPITLPIPKNTLEIAFLLQKMQWVTRKEGRDVSRFILRSFYITEYPRKRTLENRFGSYHLNCPPKTFY